VKDVVNAAMRKEDKRDLKNDGAGGRSAVDWKWRGQEDSESGLGLGQDGKSHLGIGRARG
jgi:hypothetical protein